MEVFGFLVVMVAVAVKIGLIIFFVYAMRRLLHMVDQISKETEKQTKILTALASAASSANAGTRRDP